MKFTINALILIFGFHWSIAQSINLQLKFIDKFENPITGVTVVLKNKKTRRYKLPILQILRVSRLLKSIKMNIFYFLQLQSALKNL